ncbi:MAG: ABC-2 transporter permease [Oscillospiraceae bacterium]|nr:ABC-2 transporter permease [Oscillospiraceae bacterium]
MKSILLRMWYTIRIPVIVAAAVLLILTLINPILACSIITMLSLCIAALPFLLLLLDEQSRFAHWQTLLPVPRGRIADAYYLLTLLLTAGAVLWAALIMLHYNKAEAVLRIFQLSAICLAVPAIVLPFAFRFGTKAAAVGLVLVLMMFPAVSMILMMTMLFYTSPEGGELGTVTVQYGADALLPGIAALLLFGISRMISVRIIEKREF